MNNQHLIEDSINCALEFLKIFPCTSRHDKAFKTLVNLTFVDLDLDNSKEKYEYDAIQIAAEMGEDDVKSVRAALNKLVKDYHLKHIDTFNSLATKHNFLVIPTVKLFKEAEEKNNGGRGKRNLYYISYEILDSKDKCNESDSLENDLDIGEKLKNNEVEYFVENIRITKFFNWWFNYELSGIRIVFDIALLMLVWILIVITVFYLLPYSIKNIFSSLEGLKNTYLIFISTYILIIFPIKNKWDCISKRIISILPPLAAPAKFTETQLECVTTYKPRESTGRPIRKIQLVSYWATCPVCKNTPLGNVRIGVRKGGKEFHNRLIGRCNESPTEHVFSFDHITKIGKPLRD